MDTLYLKNPFFFLYRVVLGLLYPAARIAAFITGSASLRERLGFYSPQDREKCSVGYNLWLHAASAGEVNAITPFCLAFRKAKPEARIILTTTSPTGKKIALEKGVADSVFLAPLDMAWPLKRAFLAFRPVMVLVAETEFWPQWILRTARNGLPLMLVNGRVSDRSFPSYRRFRSFFSTVLNCFSECLVQTRADGDKLAALGVSEKRVLVAGQMKYDLSVPEEKAVAAFRDGIGLGGEDILFTLGSVREGEEDQLLPQVPGLLALSPKVKVLIAPRHLKNIRVFQEKLAALGLPGSLRTGGAGERVILLDTLGELPLAYALSRAAFVGGTLTPLGGHNVMEPALSSVPVCFGPSTANVREAAEALCASGGGRELGSAGDLSAFFGECLDGKRAAELGRKALGAVSAMRGATGKTLERVLLRWPVDQGAG